MNQPNFFLKVAKVTEESEISFVRIYGDVGESGETSLVHFSNPFVYFHFHFHDQLVKVAEKERPFVRSVKIPSWKFLRYHR